VLPEKQAHKFQYEALQQTPNETNKMAKRFEYELMKPDEFMAALDKLEINIKTFARLTGVGLKTIERWIEKRDDKRQDIPPWVRLMLEYMGERGGMVLARDVAAEMIRLDNLFPDYGEFPYREEEFDDED